MDKQAIIRIGQPKAGSTSISALIKNNKKTLLEKGVWSPMSNCLPLMEKIAFELNVKEFNFPQQNGSERVKRRVDLLTQRKHTPNYETLFLTTEVIWGRIANQPFKRQKTAKGAERLLTQLKETFNDHKCQLLIHLRRADLSFESHYGQHVKSGNSTSLEDFTNRLLLSDMPDNNESFLRLASKVLGRANIIIKPFEKAQFKNNDLLDDTLSILGITEKVNDLARDAKNERLHGALIPVLRMNYAKGLKRLSRTNTKNLSRLVSQSLNIPDNRLYYDHPQRQQILAKFQHFYHFVSEYFLEGGPLFTNLPHEMPRPYKYSKDELSKVCELFDNFTKQLEN